MSRNTDMIHRMTVAPTVNDDSSNGYRAGDEWYDSTGGILYELLDDSIGAADWKDKTSSATDADILVLSDGATAYDTLRELRDITASTGISIGGEVTDGGAGTVDIASGTVQIRSTNSDTGPLYSADFAGVVAQALTDNAQNYIYIDWNAGSPQVTVTTNIVDITSNPHQRVVIGIVYREGNTVHITDIKINTEQFNQRLAKRLTFVDGLTNQTGSRTTETGTRNIAVTQGSWWLGTQEYTFPALDTSVAGTFTYYYRDGIGGWTAVASQTQINNNNYDDGDGTLGVLNNNQYGVHWLYAEPDGDYFVVYGTDSYTLTDAENSQPPAELPPFFSGFHTALIAKIIIQKGDANFTDIQLPFDTAFARGLATNHNDLGGTQGGTTDQYYHLTQADYDRLIAWNPPEVSLGDGATSGVSLFRAAGGGLQYVFIGGANGEWSTNVELEYLGKAYDGSDVQVTIDYELSQAGAVGNNLLLNLQHQFITVGDDTDGAGTTQSNTVDVSAGAINQVYSHTFTTNLTGGVQNDLLLLFSMEREGANVLDTYPGQIWVVGIRIQKV